VLVRNILRQGGVPEEIAEALEAVNAHMDETFEALAAGDIE
jgi:hypothetical protein